MMLFQSMQQQLQDNKEQMQIDHLHIQQQLQSEREKTKREVKLEREQFQHTLATLTIQSKANSFDLPKINDLHFIEQDLRRLEQHMKAYTILLTDGQ